MQVVAIENVAKHILKDAIYEATEIDGPIIQIDNQWWNLKHFKLLEETNGSHISEQTIQNG